MSFFKGKFESLSNMVSDAVATGKEALSEAKDKSVEYSQKMSESAVEAYSSTRQSLSEVVETASSSALVVATKEKVTLVSDGTVAVYETASFNIGLAYNSSSEAFGSYIGLSSERVSSYFKRSIEVDKDTDQIIAEIQGRLPARPKDVDHIFEQTK
ncbi:hypothetical protein ABI582_22155 [Pseudomonas sp. SAS7]|uniref:hypothetical protein n=1 Tax=Pseudomonas sp. SAS7 TaxID=3156487 RepID=UPI003F991C4B